MGFVLSTGQISMDSAKVEAVKNCAFFSPHLSLADHNYNIRDALGSEADTRGIAPLVWGSQATLLDID